MSSVREHKRDELQAISAAKAVTLDECGVPITFDANGIYIVAMIEQVLTNAERVEAEIVYHERLHEVLDTLLAQADAADQRAADELAAMADEDRQSPLWDAVNEAKAGN